MTPTHLKVLREETEADELRQHLKSPSLIRRQSSSFFYSSDDDGATDGWAKELRDAKDHLSRANPLSMVNEERRSISPAHKKSWREIFGMGLTSITGPSKQSKVQRSRPQLQPLETTTCSSELTDSSSEEDEEEGYEPEENRPLEARIRWHHSHVSSEFTSPNHATHIGESCGQEILTEEAQTQLAVEVRQANGEVAKKRRRAAYERKNAPIGMRLTMTSRSNYFQDRTISPTMVGHRLIVLCERAGTQSF